MMNELNNKIIGKIFQIKDVSFLNSFNCIVKEIEPISEIKTLIKCYCIEKNSNFEISFISDLGSEVENLVNDYEFYSFVYSCDDEMFRFCNIKVIA